jgi:glycosyltransferase involved in cell wall biosynthesis
MIAGDGVREDPFFSVVIPTHQARDFVVRAVESVLRQDFTSLEVVVVDNGSTDGTREALERISDPRVHYRWQEDSGLPADSRNKGIQGARGEWIAFLDADDSWRPNKLQRVFDAISTSPDVTVICHDVEVVGTTGSRLGARAYRLDERPVAAQLLYRGNFLTTSAMAVAKSALLAIGGFDVRPEYRTTEDYDAWLRLAERGERFAVIPETLGEYLVHPGGASSRLVPHYEAFMRVFDAHCLTAAENGWLDVAAALARRRRARLAETRDLVRGGCFGDALRVLVRLPAELREARSVYARAAEAGR